MIRALFLYETLVLREDWARRYAERAGATVVRSVDDVVEVLEGLRRPIEQLTLG